MITCELHDKVLFDIWFGLCILYWLWPTFINAAHNFFIADITEKKFIMSAVHICLIYIPDFVESRIEFSQIRI